MSRPSKIAYYTLEEEIIDLLFKKKKNSSEVSRILREKYKININYDNISKFKKSVIETTREFLQGSEEYKRRIAEKYIDTLDNLVQALEEINKKVDEHRDSDDWKAHATYLKLKLDHLLMVLKRANEIGPSTIIQKNTVNIIEIKNQVQIEISRLIDEGHIPLEACSDTIKEFYRKIKNANS